MTTWRRTRRWVAWAAPVLALLLAVGLTRPAPAQAPVQLRFMSWYFGEDPAGPALRVAGDEPQLPTHLRAIPPLAYRLAVEPEPSGRRFDPVNGGVLDDGHPSLHRPTSLRLSSGAGIVCVPFPGLV